MRGAIAGPSSDQAPTLSALCNRERNRAGYKPRSADGIHTAPNPPATMDSVPERYESVFPFFYAVGRLRPRPLAREQDAGARRPLVFSQSASISASRNWPSCAAHSPTQANGRNKFRQDMRKREKPASAGWPRSNHRSKGETRCHSVSGARSSSKPKSSEGQKRM